MPAPKLPFAPKSNVYLRPGQFWALPLESGRFAAGRVMAVPAFGKTDRTGVVVGLMDWVGDAPPAADDLVGRPVLVQAKSRYEAITNTGGEVLGERSLEADGLVAHDPNGPVQNVWGWATILDYAEEFFGQKPGSV